MRCFIALPLPDSDIAVLEALQNRLPFGRHVPAENLHLTLAFLDEQPPDSLEEIHATLEALSAPAFTLTLSGLDGYGGQALAINAEHSPGLRELHNRIRSRLHGLGLQLDRRRFRPHVTLARLPAQPRPDQQDRLAKFLAAEATVKLPDIPIRSFALYSSRLHPTGAEHEELWRYPLAA
ncbi:RNA 2',3'-cyclic phosphodiesterase [Puniceibacterium confluentis]|uniref:RNA 2',3'-cyclic phosphodiesterase n=1 Tax=Puniceibacterium confluentis TaxID=1958944 RepID=UPI0011B85A84|nr:RNA 2',3'-cyclic phosphodiesterase [Puniceibacterium confluentis]